MQPAVACEQLQCSEPPAAPWRLQCPGEGAQWGAGTYHGAAVVHVVGVLVGVGTEVDAGRDTREGPAVLAAQPAVGAHVLVFHLQGETQTAGTERWERAVQPQQEPSALGHGQGSQAHSGIHIFLWNMQHLCLDANEIFRSGTIKCLGQ